MTEPDMSATGLASSISAEKLADCASTAATSAADLIPAATPLAAGEAATPPADNVAYYARFTGAITGVASVVLDDAIAQALNAADDSTTAEDIIGPALTIAAETTGPCIVEDVVAATAADVPDGHAAAYHSLTSEGQPQAWIGISANSSAPATPPAQANAPAVEMDSAAASMRMELLRGVEMTLSVEIGRSKMLVRDLLQLNPGSVVELDRGAGEPADLYVNGRLIARGEVVVVDEEFGLRITQLVNDDDNDTETS